MAKTKAVNTTGPTDQPIDTTGNTPGTNTRAGEIQKENEAGNLAGANTEEKTATEDFLAKAPALVAAGVVVGDTEKIAGEKFLAFKKRTDAASLEFTGKEYGEALEILLADLAAFEKIDDDDENEGGEQHQNEQMLKPISQEDLNENNNLVLAGVVVGDSQEAAGEKLELYFEGQEWEKAHPFQNLDGTINWEKTGVKTLDNGNMELLGEEFTTETVERILQYAQIVDGKVTINNELWEEIVAESAIKKPTPPAANEGENEEEKVYHGDFLEEDQMDKKFSFDWNEVTAPEHLKYKPN